jgi:hypothetical protein
LTIAQSWSTYTTITMPSTTATPTTEMKTSTGSSTTAAYINHPYNYCADYYPDEYYYMYDYKSAPQCSPNPECGCAVVQGGLQVCTKQASCSCAQPCGKGEYCSNPNTTCVLDIRCGGEPRCFMNSLFSEQSCPPYNRAAVRVPLGDVLRKKHASMRKHQ